MKKRPKYKKQRYLSDIICAAYKNKNKTYNLSNCNYNQ